MHRTLVEFVEDDDGNALEHRVDREAPREDALGDNEDLRLRRRLFLEANLKTDCAADRFAALTRHRGGGSAGGDAAGLEQQELAITHEARSQQRRRQTGRFAGTGRGLNDDGVVGSQGGDNVVEDVVDGQARQAGQAGSGGRGRAHGSRRVVGGGASVGERCCGID